MPGVAESAPWMARGGASNRMFAEAEEQYPASGHPRLLKL